MVSKLFLQQRRTVLKKILSIVLTGALVLGGFLASCSAGGASVKGVAQKFLKALYEQDYVTASELATPDAKSGILMMASMMEEIRKAQGENPIEEEKSTFKIIRVTEDGDTAVVIYTIDDETEENTLDMVKIDGVWKADYSKSR